MTAEVRWMTSRLSASKRRVSCVHLDVVRRGAAHLKADSLAHDEGHGLGFGFAHGGGGLGAPLCFVKIFVRLCCAQHKRIYVALEVMLR
jgi:hypothetical protein